MPEAHMPEMHFCSVDYICFMKPTLSDYLIRLNALRLYTIAVNATLPLIVVGTLLSGFYGTMGFLVWIMAAPAGLIGLLCTIRREDNIILFTDDAILVQRKAGRTALSHSYTGLKKITLINRVKQRGYLEVELGGKIYRGDLDRTDGPDAVFRDFLLLLFQKNPGMESFGNFTFERFRYYLAEGTLHIIAI